MFLSVCGCLEAMPRKGLKILMSLGVRAMKERGRQMNLKLIGFGVELSTSGLTIQNVSDFKLEPIV